MMNAYSESQSDIDNEQNVGTRQTSKQVLNRCSEKRSSLVKRSVPTKNNRRPSANSVYNDNCGHINDSCSMRKKGDKSTGSASSTSGTMDSSGSSCSDGDTSSSYGEPNLPYPGFAQYSLKYLSQDTKPRIWCLQLITNPYPFQMFIIVLRFKSLSSIFRSFIFKTL